MRDDWTNTLLRAPGGLKGHAVEAARARGLSLDAFVREALYQFLLSRYSAAKTRRLPTGRIPSEPGLVKPEGQIWVQFPRAWLPLVDGLMGGGFQSRAAVIREAIFAALNAAPPGGAQVSEVS